MSRINAVTRDTIIRAALARFDENDGRDIAAQREEVQARSAELEARYRTLALETRLPQREMKILESLPRDWLKPKTSYNVVKRLSDDSHEIVRIDLNPAADMPYKFHGGYGTTPSNELPHDHEIFEIIQSRLEITEELRDLEREYDERRAGVRSTVQAIIDSVTTKKRLIEVWPEVLELVPDLDSSGTAVAAVGDLNSRLGLGGGGDE